MNAGPAAIRRTTSALREAASDVRGAWQPPAWALVAGLVVAAVAPLVVTSPVRLASLANGLYLVLAAIALAVSVGPGRMPVLSQGAFMGIGAFAAALLRARAGWSFEAALPVAVGAAAAAGLVAGVGVVRLRTAFVAVATWLLTWLVTLALLAFPGLSGGAEGLILPRGTIGGFDLTPTVHYELALALAVLAGLAFEALRRAPFGLGLAAFGRRPAAALALGVPASRLRLQAFVLSAAVAGLAGALAVDLAAIADPTAYGPLLSFELLAAVLLGGATRALGAAAGVVALGLLSAAAGSVAALERLPTERFDAVIVAALVLAALSLGGTGLVPALEAALLRRRPAAPHPVRAVGSIPPPEPRPLAARDLGKSYGSLAALRGFDLDLRPGSVAALIGPNGSGKTTALRLLAGTERPDTGSIVLAGDDVTALAVADRVKLGVVRTLQSTANFEELTVLENVLVGAGVRRAHGGLVRSATATPLSRAEAAAARDEARGLLVDHGLERVAERPAGELSALERRVLMVASALAARPSVLLVDELSAGAGAGELPRLADLVASLMERGLAVLLVEHNLRLVRAVAERVTVLDAGETIATGTPDEIAADGAVRTAYLGSQRL
ncbi:MAG: branched-chain amino acid transport system ATP-binding protein livM [Gaiellaceae bacterium]|nr:branched-chain amino acid transport system ATP-binding protein livM [Gaiellaceae bacterium]